MARAGAHLSLGNYIAAFANKERFLCTPLWGLKRGQNGSGGAFCEHARCFCSFAANPDEICYCRRCIAAWVADRREWRSPCTNERLCGNALLTPDRLRAGVAREQRRGALSGLPWTQAVLATATAQFGDEPLATREECARVARDPRLQRIHKWGAPAAHVVLELCWRGGCVDAFPRSLVGTLCDSDRHGPYPFIQRGVLASLLRSCTRSYQVDHDTVNETATIACKEHYEWRLQQVDAVFVSPERRGAQYGGLYWRAALQDALCPRQLSLVGIPPAEMRVSLLKSGEACATEDLDTTITRENCKAYFTSRLPVVLEGRAWLAARRGPAPAVFPDSSGEAEIVDSSDSDSSSGAEVELAGGLELEVASSAPVAEGEAPADAPISGARRAAAQLKSARLVVWERPLNALPRGFEYVPRVRDEDALRDTEQHISAANAALVTGLLAKRALDHDAAVQRRVRQRTR